MSERLKVRQGDYQQIADVTGFAKETVRKVLNGRHRNETIELAAKELEGFRQKLKERLSHK